MAMNRIILILLILAMFAIMVLSLKADAQETIINQPSADIVDKGHVYIRLDSFYTQKPAFFNENVNTAVGLGHNLEVSVNGTGLAHGNDTIAVVPGFKWAPVKLSDRWGDYVEVFVGDQVTQPLTHKFLPGGYAFSQGNLSYEAMAFKVGYFRLTGGMYQSVNAVAPGSRNGGFTGFEWTAKTFKNGWALTPAIDYASGAGSNGYTSPGVMISKKNFFVIPGYMIANSSHNPNGAHQSFVMAGYTF